MKKEMICIVCPISCALTVTQIEEEILVEGNRCKRGKVFGEQEFINPLRMLTSTIAIKGARLPRLPVVSSGELPINRMKEFLQVLYGVRLQAPVKKGDIVVADILGTGVDILASRSMKKS